MLRIRKYPHFDTDISEDEALALVSSPPRVAKHPFHPFIEYSDKWTKFAMKGTSGKLKCRPIMYASRRDSCIYSHYRGILHKAYESKLAASGISPVVLAYRKIPKANSKSNKNNIDFASDAFSAISAEGNCIVYTLDIKEFFQGLNHSLLKRQWNKIMDFESMPLDHYQVFRNITRYSSVKRVELYRCLGFIGDKQVGHRKVVVRLVHRLPLRVCDGKEFREKIAPLCNENQKTCGIPQGSPISDILANLYMLEFDTQMAGEMATLGGSYRRYSDDLLLIIPGHDDDCDARLARVDMLLASLAGGLRVHSGKTTVHKFCRPQKADPLDFIHLKGGGKNGLEYLGFRFDGTRVFIRDSTRSRLQRKMTYAVRSAVRQLLLSSPGKGRSDLKKLFDPKPILRQFHKVRDFEAVAKTPRNWTFWTYVLRAQKTFGEQGRPIARQVRHFRKSVLLKAARQIDKHVSAP